MIGFLRKQHNIWDITFEKKKKDIIAKESIDLFSDDDNIEQNIVSKKKLNIVSKKKLNVVSVTKRIQNKTTNV